MAEAMRRHRTHGEPDDRYASPPTDPLRRPGVAGRRHQGLTIPKLEERVMLTAEARIETDRPSRYLIQLCQHASDMGGPHGHRRPTRHRGGADHGAEVRHAEWTNDSGIVRTNWGECTLRATPGALTLRAEAADEENLRRIQDLLADRLERFGRRDQLKVTWQRPRHAGQSRGRGRDMTTRSLTAEGLDHE